MWKHTSHNLHSRLLAIVRRKADTLNTIPNLSFTPPPGHSERQQPRKVITFLGVLMLVFFAFFIIMAIGANSAGDSGALLPLILFGSFFGGIGILLILMRQKGYYQEFDDHIETRAYPRAGGSIRYGDIQATTFQHSRGQRYATIKDRGGKNYMLDLRSYKAPRLAAYLMANAAQHLPPQQIEQELGYLANGFGMKLTQYDLEQLWQINNQKFGRQQSQQPFGSQPYGNQAFNNQQFGNNSGNAFGR